MEIRAPGNRPCWKAWLEGTSCPVDPVISYFLFVLAFFFNAFSFILRLVVEKKKMERWIDSQIIKELPSLAKEV